jgi:hypothetical protein
MDLEETIRRLKNERELVKNAIAALEELLAGGFGDRPGMPKGRGRKQMPPQERKEVSERMKKYWANRRRRQPE